jgi:hypothetical protein
MPNLEAFEEKINSNIHPSLSAKEVAERIVVAALEAEYGRSFTLTRGFAKMVDALAEVIVTNPELRRQALSVASAYIKKNRDHQKNIRKGT